MKVFALQIFGNYKKDIFIELKKDNSQPLHHQFLQCAMFSCQIILQNTQRCSKCEHDSYFTILSISQDKLYDISARIRSMFQSFRSFQFESSKELISRYQEKITFPRKFRSKKKTDLRGSIVLLA